MISAAAPLTGVAGAVPIAFLLGNGTGVPATFVCMTLAMLAFSVGYVAMSRHVRNAAAFCAYAARGLGGHWGGATAFIALVAYNALQLGRIGLPGGTRLPALGPNDFAPTLPTGATPAMDCSCEETLLICAGAAFANTQAANSSSRRPARARQGAPRRTRRAPTSRYPGM